VSIAVSEKKFKNSELNTLQLDLQILDSFPKYLSAKAEADKKHVKDEHYTNFLRILHSKISETSEKEAYTIKEWLNSPEASQILGHLKERLQFHPQAHKKVSEECPYCDESLTKLNEPIVLDLTLRHLDSTKLKATMPYIPYSETMFEAPCGQYMHMKCLSERIGRKQVSLGMDDIKAETLFKCGFCQQDHLVPFKLVGLTVKEILSKKSESEPAAIEKSESDFNAESSYLYADQTNTIYSDDRENGYQTSTIHSDDREKWVSNKCDSQ
jgi:hypothetical protein